MVDANGKVLYQPLQKKTRLQKWMKRFTGYWQIYVLLLPGLIFYLIFKVVPMWGLQFAFYDYNLFGGLKASEFVWLDNFKSFMASSMFLQMLRNTMAISLINLIFYFPVPILLALLLNEVGSTKYKRINQTIVYLPHFLSWVVIAGLTFFIFSTDVGFINKIISSSGGKPIAFLTNPDLFWWILLFQTIWKEAGWGTILILATISQINPELYEAATIDGANRMQMIRRITVPLIIPTVIVLFILRLGRMLDVSFEQILLMRNSFVYSVSEVFNTYSYNQGVQMGNYSIGTTVDIFKSFVGLFMVIASNKLIKKTGQEGIY
jgi:putative aldouronate transport system permease protein